MAKAAAFPQPRPAPFMKVFEEDGVGFGEGKGNLSPERFPSPIFYFPSCSAIQRMASRRSSVPS